MSGFSFNGFVAGDTPATFTDFRVSPVRMIREGTDAEAIEVCSPAGRAFWSIYGDTGAGWLGNGGLLPRKRTLSGRLNCGWR